MIRALSFVLLVSVANGFSAFAQQQPASRHDPALANASRIYKLEELTWPQIDALDRERTMFILPVGMLAWSSSPHW